MCELRWSRSLAGRLNALVHPGHVQARVLRSDGNLALGVVATVAGDSASAIELGDSDGVKSSSPSSSYLIVRIGACVCMDGDECGFTHTEEHSLCAASSLGKLQ